MYFAHPDFEPRKLARVSTTNWTINVLNAKPSALYVPGESPAKTVTPGATTGNGSTFTAASSEFLDSDIGRQIVNLSTGETGIAIITALGAGSPSTTATCDIVEDFTDTNAIASGDWKLDLSPLVEITPTGTATGSIVTVTASGSADTFRTTDIGKYITVAGGVIQITQRTSAIIVKGEVLKSLSSSDATSSWDLKDKAWDATRGFPRSVGLYQSRLCFGGTVAQPQTVWLSESDIFDGFR